MKKSELDNLAAKTALEVIKNNQERINKSIRESFEECSHNSKISATDAVVASTALCVTLTPELSAEITATMLVKLGLVVLEDGE